MLEFEEFKIQILENIRDRLPEGYRSASIGIAETRKINESYDGLTVKKEDQPVAPSINLNQLFRDYQGHGDLDRVFGQISEIVELRAEGLDLDIFESYENAKEHLFIRVSNAETNRDLLEDVPHETLGDLAVTYHLMVERNDEGFGSTMITNELLDKYGIPGDQLKADALENSAKILSPSIESMNNVMARMMGLPNLAPESVPFEQAVEDFNFSSEGMFVLTNTNAVNGAAVMFYPEVLEQLGDHAGVDLFIIPSSVHETIILPDDGVMQRSDLESMIRDINANEVAPKDRLSDSLYHYDSREHRLERAIDFEERKEMEQTIGKKVEKVSIQEKLKDAEERVNKQSPSKASKAHVLE